MYNFKNCKIFKVFLIDIHNKIRNFAKASIAKCVVIH